MKISIITICYNNEQTIRQTIESVINQTYAKVEYIVVDGASKDSTLDIVYEYNDKIYKIISEPDRCLYDAINKGIKVATGDIVGLIHAGDRLYDPTVLENIVNTFLDTDADVTYGNSIIINQVNTFVRINKSPSFKRSRIRRGWMPSHQSIYVRRELFEKYGYYNINLHPSSDYEWFLRYFYFNNLKIHQINRFILYFTLGGISTKSLINTFKAQRQHIECWRVNGENPPLYFIIAKLLRKIQQYLLAYYFNVSNK